MAIRQKTTLLIVSVILTLGIATILIVNQPALGASEGINTRAGKTQSSSEESFDHAHIENTFSKPDISHLHAPIINPP